MSRLYTRNRACASRMHTDINGSERCTSVDSRCKTTPAHLKSLKNARGTQLSRLAVATPAHPVCTDCHCRATGTRTLKPPASHHMTHRTHSPPPRCRQHCSAHHISSAQHSQVRHTARASLHHGRELTTHGSYTDAHSGYTWLASRAHRSHARRQKQLENR